MQKNIILLVCLTCPFLYAQTITVPPGVTTNLNGLFINTGDFNNFGTVNNSGPFFFNTGTVNNNNGAIFNSATFRNFGIVNNNDGATFNNSKNFDNRGELNNNNGATFNNSGNFQNNSSFTVNSSGTINNNDGATFNNLGDLDNNGTLVNNGTFQGNTIEGPGRISGSGSFEFNEVQVIANGTTIAPGDNVGSMNVNQIEFGVGGLFELEIADVLGNPGIGFDLLNTEELFLSATSSNPFTIGVNFNDTAFTESFVFSFVQFDDIFGNFDPSSFVFLLNGDPSSPLGDFSLQLNTNTLNLTFTVAPNNPVPEPSTWLLLLFSFVVLVWHKQLIKVA